jgi:uncharacterized membrane protein YhhN/pimeloyl-ACP methyl ester carboxylesterase
MPSPRLLSTVLLIAALVAIMSADAGTDWIRAHYVAKPLATLAALCLAATAADPVSARFQRAVAIGLGFSLVGDVLLMLPADRFAAGLAAFLVAHLCYLWAFLGQSRFLARPAGLVGYTLVAATLLMAIFPALPTALRVPVVVYVVVITVMAAQTVVWLLDTPSWSSRQAAAGAAWFLVSDATLAIDRFRTDVPYRSLLVLGTYYLAQWNLARSVSRSAPGSRAGTVALMALVAAGALVTTPITSAAQTTSPPAAPQRPARLMRAGDVDTIPLTRPSTRIAYGRDSLQFGELRIPDGSGPFPVAVIVHGGCWLSSYASVRNTAALSEALAAQGVATWNVEYRRYDHPGGGWPGTFRDVADGADYVRTLAKTHALDTTRVVAVGHSAGGHLALWQATRGTLPATSPIAGGLPITRRGIVSIGGIADLREFFTRQRSTCGNPGVESLLGGAPDSVPDRVKDASPFERLPIGVPSVHIAGDRDFIAPTAIRDAFVNAARTRGDSATVVTIPGEGHFEAITPTTVTGRAVIEAVQRLLASPRR